MGRSHYERIAVPKISIASGQLDGFQSKFCQDFQAAKGKVGAEIVRVGQDYSFENATVLCLEVRGTPSEKQNALLQRFSPAPS